MPEHASVDREGSVAHFVTVGHSFGERCFHRGFASRFELFHFRRWRQEILGHVPPSTKRWFELFEYEEYLFVISPRLMLGFYVNRPDLTAVLSGVEIGAGTIVCVISPQACRIWRERNPAFAVRGNKGRTFLGGAVHIDRNLLTMPMQLFRRIRIVVNVDRDPVTLLEAKQRPRKLAVVYGGGDDSFRRDLDGRD